LKVICLVNEISDSNYKLEQEKRLISAIPFWAIRMKSGAPVRMFAGRWAFFGVRQLCCRFSEIEIGNQIYGTQ
jgi:hypothetical protein